MTEGVTITDPAALKAWVEEQYQNMAHYAANQGLVADVADGRPVWAVPGQVFLGRIWPKGSAETAYWVISGALPTDHIDAALAGTAREAARHFSLKWQLQAAQIERGAESGDEEEAIAPDWANIAERLVASAQTLYRMVEDDQYWVNVTD